MAQAEVVPDLVLTEPVSAVDDGNRVATLSREAAKGTRQTAWHEHLRPCGREVDVVIPSKDSWACGGSEGGGLRRQ